MQQGDSGWESHRGHLLVHDVGCQVGALLAAPLSSPKGLSVEKPGGARAGLILLWDEETGKTCERLVGSSHAWHLSAVSPR